MKKFGLIIASALFAATLTGCTASPDIITTTKKNDSLETTTKASDDLEDTTDSSNQEETTTKDNTNASKVTFPANLTIESSFSSFSSNYGIYKMGDEWMVVLKNEVTYIKKVNNVYKLVLGEISKGNVEWDEDAYEFKSLFKALKNAEIEFLAELDDPDGYCVKYCEKTSEKLTIAGLECVKYIDDTFDYEFWINEATGICLKNNVAGFISEVVSYSESCTAFPYAKPTL